MRKKHYKDGKGYYLGKDAEGHVYYIPRASWDCGWYWGFGYIQEYKREYSREWDCHQHMDNFLKNLFSDTATTYSKPLITETPFTQKEQWQILELFRRFYLLKELAEILHGLQCENNNACSACNRFAFNTDLLFVQYLQEGGVTSYNGDHVDFGMELVPRFELSYMGRDQLGIRSRYWYFDHGAVSENGDYVDVVAYYIDLEMFQQYRLMRHTCLDASFGVRYMDFNQTYGPLGEIEADSHGFGGTGALEAKRLAFGGYLYAQGRFSVLAGDAGIAGRGHHHSAEDNILTQTELSLGYERSCDLGNWGLLTVRAGAEWQNWANVAIADNNYGGVGNDDMFEDAGFAGFVLRVGFSR